MLHDDGSMSNHEFAIAELNYYQEQRRIHELYEVSLFAATEHIKDMLTDEQLKSWKLIESLIIKEVAENKLIDKHVREILMNKQDDKS